MLSYKRFSCKNYSVLAHWHEDMAVVPSKLWCLQAAQSNLTASSSCLPARQTTAEGTICNKPIRKSVLTLIGTNIVRNTANGILLEQVRGAISGD
jgi:hypothetical protein